jgi:hypothetical protein
MASWGALPGGAPRSAPTATTARRVTAGVTALLPGILVVYLSFNAGGFFANTQGLVTIVLLVMIAGRVAFVERPFPPLSGPLLIAGGALAAAAVWMLVSASWSDSTSRSLLAFELALLYLSALVLFGLAVRTTSQLRWLVLALAAAIVAVSAVAVTSRILPNVWPVRPNLANDRLSYPVTYWNALGLLASLGIVLCLEMATRATGARVTRALGAAAVPLLATTVYFTFSRGAILVGLVGIAVYLCLARPRGTLAGLIATLPPTAVALLVAYHADRLATMHPTTPAAVAQGHRVAWVLAACVVVAALVRAALAPLDERMRAISLPRARRGVVPVVAGGIVVVTIAVAVGLGAPSWIGRQYDRFANAPPVSEGADLRARLTRINSSGRVQLWSVAGGEFTKTPINGQGAGTFELAWERKRPFPATDLNAHSLYMEALDELGIIGFVLLATGIVAILAGLAARIPGDARTLYAALFAAGLMWALHAGFDWDWQMPVVTTWFFAVGAAAIAAKPGGRSMRSVAPAIPIRLAIVVAIALLCAFPYKVMSSQAALDRGDEDFARGDCGQASREARASIAALGVRPEPYELLAYCAIREGHPEEAIADMRDAIERDPHNWNFRYGLGIARAAAGLDPRADVREAHDMDPREPLIRQAVSRFATGRPKAWERRADRLARSFTSL